MHRFSALWLLKIYRAAGGVWYASEAFIVPWRKTFSRTPCHTYCCIAQSAMQNKAEPANPAKRYTLLLDCNSVVIFIIVIAIIKTIWLSIPSPWNGKEEKNEMKWNGSKRVATSETHWYPHTHTHKCHFMFDFLKIHKHRFSTRHCSKLQLSHAST